MAGHLKCALAQEHGRPTGSADHPFGVALGVAIDDHDHDCRVAPSADGMLTTYVSTKISGQDGPEAGIESDHRVSRLIGSHAMTTSRRLIVVALIFAVLLVGPERALAVTSTGRTSQHGVLPVFFARPGVLISLIIKLRTRCTDHGRRAIWPVTARQG